MKFETLKEFWEWLTISTGDVKTDFESLVAFIKSKDWHLLKDRERMIFGAYYDSLHLIYLEQQELELK